MRNAANRLPQIIVRIQAIGVASLTGCDHGGASYRLSSPRRRGPKYPLAQGVKWVPPFSGDDIGGDATARPPWPASAAGGSPRTGCSSPRDIWRRCGGQLRCPAPSAAFRRWCRPRGCRPLVPPRSAAGCGGAPPRPNGRRRPSTRPSAVVKKYFISNRPRGVEMYLLEVTRLTVDSCMSIASATSFSVIGLRKRDAPMQEPVLLTHDLGRDLEDGLRALVEALGQPVRRLQAIDEETLLGRIARLAGDARVVGAVDQHARQDVGVELDQPARRTLAHEHVRHHRLRPARARRRGRASDRARAARQACRAGRRGRRRWCGRASRDRGSR